MTLDTKCDRKINALLSLLKSNTTDHFVMHKGSAMKKLRKKRGNERDSKLRNAQPGNLEFPSPDA